MDEQQYCLFSPSKMAYIAVDKKARATITTNRDLAKRFTQQAAKNYLKFNVKPSFGTFCISEIEPSASQIINKKPTASQQKTTKTNESLGRASVRSVRGESKLREMMDELNAEQSQYDMQLSDLYHYAGDHPRLSACKGYKLYKKLVEIVKKRAEVKLQIAAIEEMLLRESQPYKPRTELYSELENL